MILNNYFIKNNNFFGFSLSLDEEKVEVTPKSKSKKSVFERWEESLCNCTSFPQIFLHLSSLEKSIIWSKSALHARCRICRRKGDGEHMLLCDGCDRGHHMYCLKPPVKVSSLFSISSFSKPVLHHCFLLCILFLSLYCAHGGEKLPSSRALVV